MRIGILGTGNMADALGSQWAKAGHELMVGGRTPERARALAELIGCRAGALAEAAEFGEVLLIAVPAAAVPDVLDAAGPLTGKVLIDCTNPMTPERFTLSTDGGPSMAERISTASGARVVKAFNLCHQDVWRMTPPVFDGTPLLVPLCGDDPTALATVGTLVGDLGCVPVEGGALERAGLLEATAAFLIPLWFVGTDVQAVFPPLKYALGLPK